MAGKKRKRKNIPKHMLPENRANWQEFNLISMDECEEGDVIDWREIGSECSQRRNGKPLYFYMESWEEPEDQ